MKVFKVLDEHNQSQYQHFEWPVPEDGEPGEWLEMDAPMRIRLCEAGYHGWLTEEKAIEEARNNRYNVYEMELEGDVQKDHEKACGRRARLVRLLHDRDGPVVSPAEFVWQ